MADQKSQLARPKGLDDRPNHADNKVFADVAELADAQVSGTCGLTPV
jgi:hypothetical protein